MESFLLKRIDKNEISVESNNDVVVDEESERSDHENISDDEIGDLICSCELSELFLGAIFFTLTTIFIFYLWQP